MSTYSNVSGDMYTNIAGYKALHEVCSWRTPKEGSWFPHPDKVAVLVDATSVTTQMLEDDDVLVEVDGDVIHIEFNDTYRNLTRELEAGIEALFEADPEADINVMDVCTDGMSTADKWTVEDGELMQQSVR